MHQNINVECKEDKYFGDLMETLCNKEKNHSGAAKLMKSTNKKIASYKAVELTYPLCSSYTLNSVNL
jgi:hypothetical protein